MPPNYADTDVSPDLLQAAMADLAQDLTAEWEGAPNGTIKLCTLTRPGSYLVFENFHKRNEHFVGGEDFTPTEAYLSGEQIVVRFAPTEAAKYDSLALTLHDAIAYMSGFELVAATKGVPIHVRLQEFDRIRSLLVERERNLEKFEIYKDIGFGDF